MNLALFDFDGTITRKDTFTEFLFFAADRKRLIFGFVVLAPVFLSYKLGILLASKARQIAAGYSFKGRTLVDIQSMGSKYAEKIIPMHVKPEILKKIEWHRSQGDSIVVVSASIDVYLKPWCDKNKLDLICTEFEVNNGIITGKYLQGDCSGKEKAKRIREKYNIKNYKIVYAYGDTAEDNEMMDLAHIKYFRGKQID
jgi:phosphatidylglycerophosphatase C